MLAALLGYGLFFVARQLGYGGHPRIDDRAGVLTRRQLHDFEGYLGAIENESGIDVRLVLLDRVPDGSLEAFAVRRARELGIGRRTDRRGLLFAYDLGARRVRIEVGPNLQDIFTDRFIGYVIRHHVGTFFAAGDYDLGLTYTLRLLQSRIRRASIGERYDPRAADYIEDATRLATGGGAAGTVPVQDRFVNVSGDAEARVRFAAGATVEETFGRYLELLRGGRLHTDAGIFTPGTQAFLGRFRATRAFMEDNLLGEYGRRFAVLTRGDLALLYFTDDPFLSPHLLRRGPEGWQIDLVAEVRDTDEQTGWPLTWTMVFQDDDFTRAFEDRYVKVARLWRIAGGDNRLLPMHVDTTAIVGS